MMWYQPFPCTLRLLHPSPSLTSNQELPHPGIVADNHGDYVFSWLYPMQGQGEVGMGTCQVAGSDQGH